MPGSQQYNHLINQACQGSFSGWHFTRHSIPDTQNDEDDKDDKYHPVEKISQMMEQYISKIPMVNLNSLGKHCIQFMKFYDI